MTSMLGFDPLLVRERLNRGRGRGIRIAIIDSGVEAAHPDLGGLVLTDDLVIQLGPPLVFRQGSGEDVYGHGTAIAGIIRAMAPEASIGSIRALGPNLRSRSEILCAGARKAIRLGYNILNCSFGSGEASVLEMYKNWIDEAYLKGVHVVAACNNEEVGRREWPGYFPSVLAVNFSVDPDPMSLYFRKGHMVEFSARGHQIDLPWREGSHVRGTGSSYAVPHVAGMLARLLSESPDLSPLEAKAALHSIATPWTRAIAGANIGP